MISRRVAELALECERLGIYDIESPGVTQSGEPRKPRKKEYVEALQKHYLSIMPVRPEHLEMRMELESPMLCTRYTGLKASVQEEIWKSVKWGVEEKADGVRMLAIFADGKLTFYSRHLSVENFLPVEYPNIFHTCDIGKLRERHSAFIIDCELISLNPNINTVIANRGVVTETCLQAVTAVLQMDFRTSMQIQQEQGAFLFIAFDVLHLDRRNLMNCDFLTRRNILQDMACVLKSFGLNIAVPKIYYNPVNKYRYYEKVIREGGEGVIAKHIDSIYTSVHARSKWWVKIKRTVSSTLRDMGMGDTIDGWISGGVVGTPGTKNEGRMIGFEVSVWVKYPNTNRTEEAIIAVVANIKEDLMEEITDTEAGKPVLKRQYLKKVVEIDGQNFSARGRRLRHAVFKRFRPDKVWRDCTLEDAFIEANIM